MDMFTKNSKELGMIKIFSTVIFFCILQQTFPFYGTLNVFVDI